MEASDVPRALTRNWWIAVALGIAVTQVMLAVPQYVTPLTFFAAEPGRVSQQRVKSYASVLTADRQARTAVLATHADAAACDRPTSWR